MIDVAERSTQQYFPVCLGALGIDTIDHFPKASEHMKEIIGLTKTLIDQGFAYASDGNVWFDVTRDGDYGKLSNRKVEQQESGHAPLESMLSKPSRADFALWEGAPSPASRCGNLPGAKGGPDGISNAPP